MIDNASRDRIVSLIDASVAAGANVLVDGREWASREEGSWVGPTVLMVNSVDDPTMKVLLFKSIPKPQSKLKCNRNLVANYSGPCPTLIPTQTLPPTLTLTLTLTLARSSSLVR